MIVAAILSLAVALYCYVITQLQMHDKLRWGGDMQGFWGIDSWYNKYKDDPSNHDHGMTPAKKNWYTKMFDIKYKERWLTSTNLTVMFTDGYHLFQALFFSFLSLSFTLAIGFNWWLFLGIFIGVRIVHWSARKIFSK